MTKVPDLHLPPEPRRGRQEKPKPVRQITMFSVPSIEDAYTAGAGPVIVKKAAKHVTLPVEPSRISK